MRDNRGNSEGVEGKRDKKTKTVVMVGLVAITVVVTAGIVGLNVADFKTPMSSPSSPPSMSSTATAPSSSAPIDGIECGAMEQLDFHIHAHLDIFINGQHSTVPALIGITDKCFYWLHTNDESGVIHLESPVKRDFTLGHLFDIWNKKFNNTQIFDIVVSNNGELNVYVNGTKVPEGTIYRDIVLHAHDVISIVYGKPPNAIPSQYEFLRGQ
jgi:hypothetical protein